MYLKLSQVYFYFEYIVEPNYENESYYLNTKDYQMCNKDEKHELIYSDLFVESDFLPIPQIDRNDIVVKYLTEKNNRKLIRQRNDKEFFGIFHIYTEDNRLVEEWLDFEKTELINYAAAWCEQNQIKYTLKP